MLASSCSTILGLLQVHVPLMLFLSNLHPAKSESEYPLRLSVASFGYHNPTLVVPLRYLRILFVVLY